MISQKIRGDACGVRIALQECKVGGEVQQEGAMVWEVRMRV
jgi:hypothetical protein